MARIRSIHPGIWTDPEFVSLSRDARLLFIGIWNEADDQGVFVWQPIQIKMRLAPADNVDVGALLAEMEAAGRVLRFTASGRDYGAVRNFQRYQRPKKPNAVHPTTPNVALFTGAWRAEGVAGLIIDPTAPELGIDEGAAAPYQFSTGGELVSQNSENPPQRKEEGGRRKKKEGFTPQQVETTRLAPSLPRPATGNACRATRLAIDWQPTGEYAEFARSGGLNPAHVALAFRDYWLAKAGADATKMNWLATWRAWCRRDRNWREPDASAAQATLPVPEIDCGRRPTRTVNPATGHPYNERELTDIAAECGL